MTTTTMKAVVARGAGGPEVLAITERALPPAPAPGLVRVKVAACGLNRADCMQRLGLYPAPPGWPKEVLGLEYAGQICALGEGVQGVQLGERVMGLVGGGAMSEFVDVHPTTLLPVPPALSMEEAAAIPEVYLTSFDALFVRAQVRAGDRVLVHAIGSGIGTASLTLAQLAGVELIGTSRSEAKLERARVLGLAHAILTQRDGEALDFAEAVRALGGADVVLDTIGAKYVAQNLDALNVQGRIVTIGLLGGRSAEVNLGLLLRKRITWCGSVLRSRAREEHAALVAKFLQRFGEALRAGEIRAFVDEALPMAEIARAHALLESNQVFGKLVLRW